MEDHALEQAGLLARRRRLLERDLERLDHPAILDPGRTGSLARPAVQAELEVLADARSHLEPAVGDGAHQVDPAPRAVILVARLEVCRAARRAEAAVDTFLVTPIGDLVGEPIEVDRRGRLGLRANRAGLLPFRGRSLHQVRTLVAGGSRSRARNRWPVAAHLLEHNRSGSGQHASIALDFHPFIRPGPGGKDPITKDWRPACDPGSADPCRWR